MRVCRHVCAHAMHRQPMHSVNNSNKQQICCCRFAALAVCMLAAAADRCQRLNILDWDSLQVC